MKLKIVPGRCNQINPSQLKRRKVSNMDCEKDTFMDSSDVMTQSPYSLKNELTRSRSQSVETNGKMKKRDKKAVQK